MALDKPCLKIVRDSASLKEVFNLLQMLEENFFVYDRLVSIMSKYQGGNVSLAMPI